MTIALVLIDLQNDYFPGGAMELVEPDAAVAHASTLLRAFRERALPVFHVQHVSTRAGATFFLPGTRGVEIHDAVAPRAGEDVIVKHFPNAWRETKLHELLRARGITSLAFAGMMTHMCVDTSVRAAADLRFECRLAHDACATRSLAFGGHSVAAADVQASYLAGLDGAFARVQSARELAASL